jgi:hypothetical protein
VHAAPTRDPAAPDDDSEAELWQALWYYGVQFARAQHQAAPDKAVTATEVWHHDVTGREPMGAHA